jgi:diguanylate cyclase (GGDEF)-like protein
MSTPGKNIGMKDARRKTSRRVNGLHAKLKRPEKVLSELAILDPLTHLYNRRYFNHRIKEEIAQAERNHHALAILNCDLDHFKVINDRLGHRAGDGVLKSVAKGIQDATRGTDLVFRWGGDEILVVLAKTNPEGLLIAGDRIRKAVRKIGEKTRLDLDLSIGAAVYPEHGRTAEELMLIADLALYIAKGVTEKIQIGTTEYNLNEHSIKIVFQPILDVRSKEIIGYEALSRDPEGNLDILDLFKRYRVIGRLNELKRICFKSQLKAAKAIGLQRVFINVDVKMLTELEAVPKAPPDMEVILEISELEAIHNIEDHLSIAREWRERGFKFAIDDFGAGFVSLPFIAQLIPEYIKVDRSTILQAMSSESFRGFLKDLVLGLKNFTTEGIIAEGIETVAEGVETERELEVVREIGIHLAQGFSLGKPQELK